MRPDCGHRYAQSQARDGRCGLVPGGSLLCMSTHAAVGALQIMFESSWSSKLPPVGLKDSAAAGLRDENV